MFWDRTIPAGRPFEEVIEEQIASAKAVVVLWSKHSVRSAWVRAEASDAANRGILVPASLDGEPPPLRYRIAQTANLADWRPGNPTGAFTTFLQDVAQTARGAGPPGSAAGTPAHGRDREPRRVGASDNEPATRSTMGRLLKASIVFAWTGSIGLALTVAGDYGLITSTPALYVAAYFVTLLSLAAGGLATAAFGGLSLKRQFVAGVLQGWLWPIVVAIGELVLIVNARHLIAVLPVKGEFDILLAFVLCGAIGPSLLTAGAIVTKRALDGAR